MALGMCVGVQSQCQIRDELKDTGVTVTVLQPGATETEFFGRADLMDTKVGQEKKADPALVAKQGFAAMMAGKDSVLAGSLKSKVEARLRQDLTQRLTGQSHARPDRCA